MTKEIIALDCDGVLLDYAAAYPAAWKAAFGEDLVLKNV
jgi:beta-phosphoglucomutase-like phosphatase (HAD superfamily)